MPSTAAKPTPTTNCGAHHNGNSKEPLKGSVFGGKLGLKNGHAAKKYVAPMTFNFGGSQPQAQLVPQGTPRVVSERVFSAAPACSPFTLNVYQSPAVQKTTSAPFTFSSTQEKKDTSAMSNAAHAPLRSVVQDDSNKENWDPRTQTYTSTHHNTHGRSNVNGDAASKRKLLGFASGMMVAGGPLVDITQAYAQAANRQQNVPVRSELVQGQRWIGLGWGGEVITELILFSHA
jgi:hypothetical protein